MFRNDEWRSAGYASGKLRLRFSRDVTGPGSVSFSERCGKIGSDRDVLLLTAGLVRFASEWMSKLWASISMRNFGAAAMPILQLAYSINEWITDGPNRLQENSTSISASLWKTVGKT
jgi:hypothetical protein